MSTEPDDLEERLLSLAPPVETPPSAEDYAEQLRELEDASEHEPEPEPEEVPTDGQIILTWTRSVVRRDDNNRIVEIVSGTTRKFIERDVFGTVVAINEVTETEEVEEPEEE